MLSLSLGLLSTPSVAVALAVVVVAVALVYWVFTKEYGVFEKQGIHSIKPHFFFGNQKELLTGKINILDYHLKYYKATKGHRYCIHYEGSEAQLYVRDPDLIKQIAIKDFDHFTDLGFVPVVSLGVKDNDLGLGTARGHVWRAIRQATTPAFSLRNLKNITVQVNQNAKRVVDHLMLCAEGGKDFCIDDTVGCFTMDCIAKTVFSIDIDALKNPDSDFFRNGKELISIWRFFVTVLFPRLAALFGVPMFNPKATKFFSRLATEMIRQRESNPNPPNDVLGLMIKARDSKTAADLPDENEGSKLRASDVMTNHVITRTLMQFFMDGYDTTASVALIAIYFLAANPEVQERASEEVDELSTKLGGNLTGEDVAELKYLDCVVSETTRMAPSALTLRICTKEWTIPDTDVKIPPDMRVVFPIGGIHYDPEYFEHPDIFDPDRFSAENKSKIRSGTFLPFGMGGRACIGMGIARLEIKVLLFHLLRNFRVRLAQRTQVPPVWAKDHFIRLEGGLWVQLQRRD